MEIAVYIAIFVAFAIFARVSLLKNRAIYTKIHNERTEQHKELMEALERINSKLEEQK